MLLARAILVGMSLCAAIAPSYENVLETGGDTSGERSKRGSDLAVLLRSILLKSASVSNAKTSMSSIKTTAPSRRQPAPRPPSKPRVPSSPARLPTKFDYLAFLSGPNSGGDVRGATNMQSVKGGYINFNASESSESSEAEQKPVQRPNRPRPSPTTRRPSSPTRRKPQQQPRPNEADIPEPDPIDYDLPIASPGPQLASTPDYDFPLPDYGDYDYVQPAPTRPQRPRNRSKSAQKPPQPRPSPTTSPKQPPPVRPRPVPPQPRPQPPTRTRAQLHNNLVYLYAQPDDTSTDGVPDEVDDSDEDGYGVRKDDASHQDNNDNSDDAGHNSQNVADYDGDDINDDVKNEVMQNKGVPGYSVDNQPNYDDSSASKVAQIHRYRFRIITNAADSLPPLSDPNDEYVFITPNRPHEHLAQEKTYLSKLVPPVQSHFYRFSPESSIGHSNRLPNVVTNPKSSTSYARTPFTSSNFAPSGYQYRPSLGEYQTSFNGALYQPNQYHTQIYHR